MPDGGVPPLADAEAFTRLSSIEAEHALLGALFHDNRAFEHVADIVGPEDFSHPTHGRIFDAMARLIGNGAAANPVTLAPLAPELGIDRGYLAKLAMAAVTTINAPEYARVIADLSWRRDIVLASQDTIADALVVDPDRRADTVLDEAEERLFVIGERQTSTKGPTRLGDILLGTIERIEAAYKAGGAITIDTGLADLDRIISGMGAGDLCVLAGRPAMGKSALAGTVAFNVANRGKRVLMFSLEMTREELSQRWIAGLTGIQTDRQRHGSLDPSEWGLLTEAQASLNKLPILVDDQSRLSVPQMRQRARRVRRRYGLDLIIIDHLQLVRQGGKQESRRLEIGDATSSLKAIAKELKVPVLLLSQLNRGVEHRENKRPGLADLKESGDIEQDADLVMFLYREEYYLMRAEPRKRPDQSREGAAGEYADWEGRCLDARGIAEIEIAKNRHGKTGVVKAMFDAERQRFENLARGF